jgi:hypothetical protein
LFANSPMVDMPRSPSWLQATPIAPMNAPAKQPKKVAREIGIGTPASASATSAAQNAVDINQALFDRLVRSGVKTNRIGDIDVWTCEGRERRPVYRVEDLPLAIENEQGKPIVETEDSHLIVKPANACGGIADLPEPAAQLGASFLRLFGTVIFDPKRGRRTSLIGGSPATMPSRRTRMRCSR